MRSKIKISITLGLAVLAGACTDLDVDVKSKYTEYPSSEIALEAKMADVYYAFRSSLGNIYNRAQTLSSDEVTGISFDGDYYDNAVYSQLSLHTYTADNGSFGYWSNLASGITKCNQVIIDLGGDEAEPAMLAPARVMRAFYHFILMDSFGDIPILNRIPDENEAVVRDPRKEVAEFIESELLECLPYLSDKNDASTYGKPNSWMAKALLVKLYINWSVYTAADITTYLPTNLNNKLNDCIYYCDDIIHNGPFDLNDSYRKKFFPDNGVHIKDFIYAMPYDCSSAQGMLYGRFRTFRRIDNGNGAYYGATMGNSCAGNYAMNPEFSDLFCLAGDERNGAVLGGKVFKFDASTYEPTNEEFIYNDTQLEFTKTIVLKTENDQLNTGADATGWRQGYRSIKFYPNPNEYRTYSRNQSNDVPIFRLADIILTKAEAILRGGTSTKGENPQSLLNSIRNYVNAPSFEGTPDLQDILDERGRELFDENWRRNDMIRFGTFESEYGFHKKSFSFANFDLTRRIFPVPQSVLDENSNWKQNPGY